MLFFLVVHTDGGTLNQIGQEGVGPQVVQIWELEKLAGISFLCLLRRHKPNEGGQEQYGKGKVLSVHFLQKKMT